MNSYYGNYGTLPPSPGSLFPAGLPQSSASFFPTAAYDTRWVQTPVTYYRPVTQFDPRYGTTVTSLQPCTSYQYQAARVPLVSPQGFSDHSYSANRWPAAMASPVGPTYYPSLQQLPGTGMQVTSPPIASNRVNGGNTGLMMPPAVGGVVSANHLAPIASPSAPVALTQQAFATQPTTSWLPSSPMPQTPITSAIPGTGTPIYTVPGTVAPTAWLPSAMAPTAMAPTVTAPTVTAPTVTAPTVTSPCPNGICVPGTSSTVPGVTSMVSPPSVPSVNQPIMPNQGDINPVLPPTAPADPEAMRQPSLGASAPMYPMKRVPVSDIEKPAPASLGREMEPSTNLSQPSSSPSLRPLQAPRELDTKPRWNPKLLPPRSEGAKETVASTPVDSCVTV